LEANNKDAVVGSRSYGGHHPIYCGNTDLSLSLNRDKTPFIMESALLIGQRPLKDATQGIFRALVDGLDLLLGAGEEFY